MVAYTLQISPISLGLSEAGVRALFENFGKVESVRFAKAADGQLVKVDRHPPSKSHKVLKDMGGYEFSLTVGHTEDPVTHEFGTAVVTMPDKGDSFTAMAMLTDVVIDGFVIEVERLGVVEAERHGREGAPSRCEIL